MTFCATPTGGAHPLEFDKLASVEGLLLSALPGGVPGKIPIQTPGVE